MKPWLTRILLAFVWITLGFALGRRTAPSTPSAMNAADVAPDESRAARAHQVVIYAAHMTFRCPECNQIEWLARELVENEFGDELADGRMVFRTVDYMRDTAFARRYNIASSTIVVVRIQDGEEQTFQRLDEVWTKLRDRGEYFDYVRVAILRALNREPRA